MHALQLPPCCSRCHDDPSRSALTLAAGDVLGGVTRQYYMAAERQLWDHIPLGADACGGALQPLVGEGAARAFNNASTSAVGSQRFRATFYEYTDATFTTRKVVGFVPPAADVGLPCMLSTSHTPC